MEKGDKRVFRSKIITFLVYILVPILVFLGFTGGNLAYDNIDGVSSSTNTLDFTSLNIKANTRFQKGISCQADFYWERWIVEDGMELEPEKAEFPSDWVFAKHGPKGYASYRFFVEGIPADIDIGFSNQAEDCSYKVFYRFASESEFTLLFEDGKVSKTSFSPSLPNRISAKTLKSNGETIEFVYETGLSFSGGIKRPIFISNSASDQSRYFQSALYGMEFILPLLMIFYSIVIFFGSDRKENSTLMTILGFCPFGIYIFGEDFVGGFLMTLTHGYWVFPLVLMEIMQYVATLAFMLIMVMCVWKREGTNKFKSPSFIACASISLLALPALFWSEFLFLGILPMAIYLGYSIAKNVTSDRPMNAFSALFGGFTLSYGLIELASSTGFFSRFTLHGTELLVLIPIAVFFFGVRMRQIFINKAKTEQYQSFREADKAEKKKIETLQQGYSILKDALPIIRTAYAGSLDKGDALIEMSAKNARNAIDAGDKGHISLSEEIAQTEDVTSLYNSLYPENAKEIYFDIENDLYSIDSYALSSFVLYLLRNSSADSKTLIISINENMPSLIFSGDIYAELQSSPETRKRQESVVLKRGLPQ